MHTLPLAVLAAPLLLVACTTAHHQIIDRELAWADAMRAGDQAALTEIMAPDFRLTFEQIPPFMLTADNGQPIPGVSGARWRSNVEVMTFGPVEMSKVNVVTIADDLVAVNMWMYLEDWISYGETRDPLYELTDVWANRDGQWKVITRFSRPLDEAEFGRPTPDFVSAD